MLVFVLVIAVSSLEAPRHHSAVYSLWAQLKALFTNAPYMVIVLGQAANIFTVAGLAFWGNNYIEEYYGLDPATTVISFSVANIVTVLVGTYVGSALLESLIYPKVQAFEALQMTEAELSKHRTVTSCVILVGCTSLGACLACKSYIDPTLLASSVWTFLALLTATQFFLFT